MRKPLEIQPSMDAQELVAEFVSQTSGKLPTWVEDLNSGLDLLSACCEEQLSKILPLLDREQHARVLVASLGATRPHREWWCLAHLQIAILRQRPVLRVEDVERIANFLSQAVCIQLIWKPMLRAISDFSRESSLTSAARQGLEQAKQHQFQRLPQPDWIPFERTINSLLGIRRPFVVSQDDGWGSDIADEIAAADPNRQAALVAVLDHCQAGVGSKPSARWLKIGAGLVAGVPGERFADTLTGWLTGARDRLVARHDPARSQLSETNQEIVRGLICLASTIPDNDSLARCLGSVAQAMFAKTPPTGAHSTKLGNASVFALGQMPSMVALGQLAYLKSRIKLRSAQKEIDKALQSTAARLNVSRDDLEELAIPTYGLTSVGHLEEPLGDFTAELAVVDSGRTTLAWRKPDGKLQKSVPASVKSDFPEELKDLKAAAKDIEKMLTAQRERLDNLFLQQRRWSADIWRERYLDHPLVGILARRLIWNFKNTGLQTAGCWLWDTVVDVDDEPIDWIDAEGTTVELWHPIGRPMDDVLSWRHWLERHEVRQPFKQAHREVYVLTDAERRTGTYSNRYAAHILRQHQFNALCAARSWANKLRMMVDADYSPPTKRLENWGLRAEFWVDTVGDQYGTDTTDLGAFLYLSTDQVRFYRLDADRHVAHATGGRFVTQGLDVPINQPLPLELIPPIIFSEVMRDVDMFVGVASVGNDPTWSDGGPGGRYREYWQNFAFGDLTPSAQTRKQVLERLLPRLKIGPRCSFSEKFLVVRGELRTYKIHLGSGNILMEPNDQYLCIVPDSSAVTKGDSVFLPFEGDRTLSIILSKAMLLADDQKITDPTITRQIRLS